MKEKRKDRKGNRKTLAKVKQQKQVIIKKLKRKGETEASKHDRERKREEMDREKRKGKRGNDGMRSRNAVEEEVGGK